jgi:TamB, inner membrane protein subunit of TAM complex
MQTKKRYHFDKIVLILKKNTTFVVLKDSMEDVHEETLAPEPQPTKAHDLVEKTPLPLRFAQGLYALVRDGLLVATILVGSLYAAVQSERVQNYAADCAAEYLSKELHTTVAIDKINIEWLSGVRLKGLYVADLHGDTLLYAQSLEAGIDTRALLNSEVKLHHIRLDNTRATLDRSATDTVFNYQFLVDYFAPKKTTKSSSKGFVLNEWHGLEIMNLRFEYNDAHTGTFAKVGLPHLDLLLNDVNSETQNLDIEKLLVEKPILKIKKTAEDRSENVVLYYKNKKIQAQKDSIVAAKQAKSETKNHKHSAEKSAKVKILPHFMVQNFTLSDADIAYNNTLKSKKTDKNAFDENHLDFKSTNIDISKLKWNTEILTANIHNISTQEASGLDLKQFKTKLNANHKTLKINDFDLKINNSELKGDAAFDYENLDEIQYFIHKIETQTTIEKAEIAMRDVARFVPALTENPDLRAYLNENVAISGKISGNIAKINAENLSIKIKNRKTELLADLKVGNITNIKTLYIDANIKKFNTNSQEIKDLVPKNIVLPKELDKIGSIALTGTASGYLKDFDVSAKLTTDLGRLETRDFHLDLHSDPNNYVYDGTIALTNFDLRRLTGNAELGIANLVATIDGRGVKLNTVAAKIDAVVQDITLKGYRYNNIKLFGRLEQQRFDGTAAINDPLVQLTLIGKADLTKLDYPIVDASIVVPFMDLKALHLTPDVWIVRNTNGKIDFKGIKPDEIVGNILLNRGTVQHDTVSIELGSVKIASTIDSSERKIEVDSDMLRGKMKGKFRFDRLANAFAEYFERNFPSFADEFKIHPQRTRTFTDEKGVITTENIEIQPQLFDATFKIVDTRNALNLIPKNPLSRLRNIDIDMYFDSERDVLFGGVETQDRDSIQINNVILYHPTLALQRKDGDILAKIDADIDRIRIGKLITPSLHLNANAETDKLNFALHTGYGEANPSINVSDLAARGNLTMDKKAYFQVHFDTASFVAYNQTWTIPQKNYIKIKGDTIKTDNFRIENNGQRIALKASGGKGLFLKIENLKSGWISEEIAKIKGLKFDGAVSGLVGVNDFRKREGFFVRFRVADLLINDRAAGDLELHADADSLNGNVTIRPETQWLYAGNKIELKGNYFKNNTLDINAKTSRFDINIAEKFLPAEISETSGYFVTNLKITGPAAKPDIAGDIYLYDVGVKINYLQNKLSAPYARAIASSTMFDVSNTKVYDKDGNIATLYGGISHNHFADLGPSIKIVANRFTLINTKPGDNSTFYGLGMGENVVIDITGTFDYTNLILQATTGRDTKIIFPLHGNDEVKAGGFIKFKKIDSPNVIPKKGDKTAEIIKKRSTNPKGVELVLKLDVTPNAAFELIFDETSGEKMRSNGTGQLALALTRQGDFTMTGKYEIAKGDYLFTKGGYLNKPFVVRQGGTISWEGSPYDAVINLTALYKDLRVSPQPLLSEYLTSITSSEASNSTNVDLNMLLTGSLLKPDIAFKIDLPSLSPSLKTYWQAKQRLLQDDPNEMNRQVFGLMMMRSFLPSQGGLNFGNNSIANTSLNTITEVLSNQLTGYFNDMLSEVLRDETGVFSGMNLGINYKTYDIANQNGTTPDPAGGTPTVPNTTTRDEVQFGLKNTFLDNRLLLDVGGNVDISRKNSANAATNANTTQSGTYFGWNFTAEYLFTADGRFRIRAYARPEPTFQNPNGTRVGTGIQYRYEYDSLEDFKNGFKREVKKRKAGK